jgi:hypothetical protein
MLSEIFFLRLEALAREQASQSTRFVPLLTKPAETVSRRAETGRPA